MENMIILTCENCGVEFNSTTEYREICLDCLYEEIDE